jgi:hypothetical protein
VLAQLPSAVELAGVALVVTGVAVHAEPASRRPPRYATVDPLTAATHTFSSAWTYSGTEFVPRTANDGGRPKSEAIPQLGQQAGTNLVCRATRCPATLWSQRDSNP